MAYKPAIILPTGFQEFIYFFFKRTTFRNWKRKEKKRTLKNRRLTRTKVEENPFGADLSFFPYQTKKVNWKERCKPMIKIPVRLSRPMDRSVKKRTGPLLHNFFIFFFLCGILCLKHRKPPGLLIPRLLLPIVMTYFSFVSFHLFYFLKLHVSLH